MAHAAQRGGEQLAHACTPPCVTVSRCLRRRLLDRLAALPGVPATGDAVAAAIA